MASASPALSASRSTGFDFRRPHEYPILLGDSLRNNSDAKNQLLNLRYNWQPSTGLRDVPGTLKKTSLGYSLALGNDAGDNNTYYYKGHSRPEASDTISYALIFNKQKSAFLLEKVTKSIDMNVDEGPSIRYEAARDLKQLPRPSKYAKPAASGDINTASIDNEEADQSNPFDFRHFLADAKEIADRSAHLAGGNTPLAGGRTPIGGFPSPAPGPTRIGSTTPHVKPTAASSSLQMKRKVDDEKKEKSQSSGASGPQRSTRKAGSKAKEIRSKEKISSSDEELNDTIIAAKTESRDKLNSHNGPDQSPHIVLNDGGLEIDMGSPPREDGERKRGRLDLGAFRGPTDHSINSRSRNQTPKELPLAKTTDSEPEEDTDIEELELGSPRSPRLPITGSRSVSILEPPPVPATSPKPEHAPTPTDRPIYENDDDDDDDLAAEFEAALDEADQDASAGNVAYGLGISGSAAPDNEESEVSEEE